MNKFETYEASYITPQKTIVRKLDYVIKYLRQNPTVNQYHYDGTLSYAQLSQDDLELENHEVQLGDMVVDNDCNYAFVSTIGENVFSVRNISSSILKI